MTNDREFRAVNTDGRQAESGGDLQPLLDNARINLGTVMDDKPLTD